MANFCSNCGTKIRKEDKFCSNCGTKLIEENNFCINCGTKLGEEDKFCINCGTKIDKSNIKQEKHLSKSLHDKIKKEIDIIAKQNEEKKKKLKTIDEILESEEIKSEIRKNNINQIHVNSIKNSLKNKIIHNREEMSEEEIKYFIKTELEKASEKQKKAKIAKEKMSSKKIEKNKIAHGNYCNLNCRHCYEEFLDSGGGIVGDFDDGGYVEYYCRLGHSLSFGRFCDDYE